MCVCVCICACVYLFTCARMPARQGVKLRYSACSSLLFSHHTRRDDILATGKIRQSHLIQVIADPESEDKSDQDYIIVNGHHRFEAYTRLIQDGSWSKLEGPHRLNPEEEAECSKNQRRWNDKVTLCNVVSWISTVVTIYCLKSCIRNDLDFKFCIPCAADTSVLHGTNSRGGP